MVLYTQIGLQEACSALAEVLPTDVASSLVHLWEGAMTGSQLSTFCDTLEEQVSPSLHSLISFSSRVGRNDFSTTLRCCGAGVFYFAQNW